MKRVVSGYKRWPISFPAMTRVREASIEEERFWRLVFEGFRIPCRKRARTLRRLGTARRRPR